MFWGLILKSNKKYTQTLEKSLHLSQAALDHASSDNDPVQVMCTHQENTYLLCTLQKGKNYQDHLDLNFQKGDVLSFSSKGNGIVHLTGYLMQDEEDFFGEEEQDSADEDESMDEEEMEDLRKKLEEGRKKKKPGKEPVAQKVEEPEEDDSDDDDFDEENGQDDDESGEEEEEESSDGEGDAESDDSDEEEASPPPKQAKLDPKAQKNGKENKKQKQEKKGLENGDAKPQKQQQQQQQKGNEGGQIKKLQGGLMVQDLKVGNGAEAKPGKKVQVYYEGRLKSNNKVFDATKNGPGFKFSIGRGEVIRGWDLGISGMKVGGKRRLVCPPQLAYGQKGNPPVIPQNATLVFDVELKNVL